MAQKILSILIPTLPSRGNHLKRLITQLKNQCGIIIATDEHQENGVQYLSHIFKDIQILIGLDNKQKTVGEKRQLLLEKSEGEYICFIDDDDSVMNNYISEIMKALKSKPDCVGFNGYMTTNGQNKQQFYISKNFKSWYTRNNIHYRTPNHLSPVKREIALKQGFEKIQRGEDSFYSNGILRHLQTEIYIQHDIYHYEYNSNNSETQ